MIIFCWIFKKNIIWKFSRYVGKLKYVAFCDNVMDGILVQTSRDVHVAVIPSDLNNMVELWWNSGNS